MMWVRHLNGLSLHGISEGTAANPEVCRREGPECTAFGQSGLRTRPFSPMLPVMDRRALWRMASVKVNWNPGGMEKRSRKQNSKSLNSYSNKVHHYKCRAFISRCVTQSTQTFQPTDEKKNST